MDLLVPDVEGLPAVGVGVAAQAAIPADNAHHHFVQGVFRTQDVGIDPGAVMRLTEDVFST